MTDFVSQPGQPGRGFRLVTNDGKEKFLPIPMPLTKPADLFAMEPSEPAPDPVQPVPLGQGDGQPPSEPPQSPPEMAEPEPEKQPEKAEETAQAKIIRLEKEYADLLPVLYWIETQLAELKQESGK